MICFFSERYKDLVNDKCFVPEFSNKLWSKLYKSIMHFNAEGYEQPNRYDSWKIRVTTESSVMGIFCDHKGWEELRLHECTEEFYFKRQPCEWFEILELWYEYVPEYDRLEFQHAINQEFSSEEYPWRMANGRMCRIDPRQFEMDLKLRTINKFESLLSATEKFDAAYSELRDAIEKNSLGEHKEAIHAACNSFESVLKVVLGTQTGNANRLLSDFVGQYLQQCPGQATADGVKSNVLLSLPYLRNKMAGHGAGWATMEANAMWAQLAINLSCALNSFVMDVVFSDQISTRFKDEASANKGVNDDLPF